MTLIEKDEAVTKINKFYEKPIRTPTRKSSSAPSTPARKRLSAPSVAKSLKPTVTFDSMTKEEKSQVDDAIMKVCLNF